VFALENVPNFVKKQSENSKFVTVLCSEDGFENPLPFLQKNGQYALILSHLTLHAANDVLGTLIQIYQSLSVAGCFIGVAPGGGTLQELRGVFLEADISMQNGASPRIFPMGQIQDWGLLMQKAGFAFVAVDTNKLTVWYNDPLKLMHDLRYIGEANALYERTRKITKRSVFEELCRLYRKQWGRADGKVPASFEMIYFIGWKIDNRHSSYEKISLALQGLLSK
jgi:SAM-dependent methyltransferase